MRMAFIWNYDKAHEIYDYWRDGLKRAIEIIGRENDVDVFLGRDYLNMEDIYDCQLYWTDSNDPIFQTIEKYKGKKGIILTTDPQNFDNLKKLDVVFCESQPVKEQVRAQGLKAVKAFATDTDFYMPDLKKEKDMEYFYPATFSPWKLQRDIAHLGDKLWCIGTVQPDGLEDLQACEQNNVNIAKGYFKAEYIRDCYQRAKKVPIPAIHGSERTVLEAMACNIVPDVTNVQNIRTRSYIEEYANASRYITPRDFVLGEYSPKKYAEKLLYHLS